VRNHFLIATMLSYVLITTKLSPSSLIHRSVLPHCYNLAIPRYYSARAIAWTRGGSVGEARVREAPRGSVTAARDRD
jgi:hypothetical protein